MGLYLVAYPKDYRTAVELFKKRKELESYHDDLIPNNAGVGPITVVHPRDLSDFTNTVALFNELKPRDIAYIRLTITGFVYGTNSPRLATKMVKEHVLMAIEKVRLDSKKFRFEVV